MSGVLEWVRSRSGQDQQHDGEEQDRKEQDHSAEEGPAEAPVADVVAQSWTFGGTLAARAAIAAMWVLLLSGPVGLVVAVSGSSTIQPSAPRPAGVGGHEMSRSMAGEFTIRAVSAWLTTPVEREEELQSLLPGAEAHQVPYEVADPSLVSVAPASEPDSWLVTVSVTVTGTDGVSRGQYFMLPVWCDGTAVAAAGLPGPVAGPGRAEPPERGFDNSVPVAGPVGSTVAEFMAAMVAGTGEIERYVAPGAEPIRPVTPTPYEQVELVKLQAPAPVSDNPADGERARVLVTADLIRGDQTIRAQWVLTLASRAGRWEILEVNPAPAVEKPEHDQPT